MNIFYYVADIFYHNYTLTNKMRNNSINQRYLKNIFNQMLHFLYLECEL